MLAAVKAVKQLITGKNDAAALQQQIAALKREGSEASEEIERLKRERALAASFEEAEETDRAIARQMWITEHAAAALPDLELRLAAVRAADQAAAIARHKTALIDLYPKLKRAILAAVEMQHEAMALHEAACREVGEAAAFRNLPTLAFAGFLTRDLVAIWQTENDRIFTDLARRPKPAAIAAPARAALPAPTKPPAATAPGAVPARAARQALHDTAPADDGERLVTILRNGVELVDGRQCAVGDVVRVSSEKAGQLLRSGAAEEAK